MAPFFGDILNISQVGDEKADHNILAIVQTALFPYCQLFPGKCEGYICQFCEILGNVIRKDDVRIVDMEVKTQGFFLLAFCLVGS